MGKRGPIREKGRKSDLSDIRAHVSEDLEGSLAVLENAVPLHGQVHVEDGERRHVGSIKSFHLARAAFRCAIPSEDLVVEVDDNFGDLVRACDHQ